MALQLTLRKVPFQFGNAFFFVWFEKFSLTSAHTRCHLESLFSFLAELFISGKGRKVLLFLI